MLKNLLPAIILYLFLPFSAKAQDCGCLNCPINIPDLSLINVEYKVNGATANDLADANQGVRAVFVEFTHDYMPDLEMRLFAPNGNQFVLLIGPQVEASNTFSTNFDVSFVRCDLGDADPLVDCNDPVNPDPGIPPKWDNDNEDWQSFANYTGSYFPYSSCLQSFNTGPVNGIWRLEVADLSPIYEGRVKDFSVLFCDMDGIECCEANAGVLSDTSPVSACQGSNQLDMNVQPQYDLSLIHI